MKPKIIVQGKFYPKDIDVDFSKLSGRKIDFEIENKIDKKWKEHEKEKKQEGGMIWDSVTYRLENLKAKENKLNITLGEIKYSKRIGARWFLDKLEKLGDGYYPKGIYLAAIVKTKDEYYVMGDLSGKTLVLSDVSLVGGVLSKDEGIIEKSDDIFGALQREVKEELNIDKENLEDIYLKAVILTERLAIGFIFCASLNMDMESVQGNFIANDEFVAVKGYEKKEIKDILKSMGGAKALVGELI
ncbi:MAG: hypothetical protein ACD_7C00397G0001 [uncultured bacterium]|nr:MAG: hypothetical protein ACD_7C00397G0001 [uncultured bacterium]KKP69227.1 MAG: hypothetical protein UR66_C0001G0109 [Candidatus Moranbacteria bacterium GW2011_GWE1_35_17]KKP73125.1 MAG: hypothetical protein UR65_C0007G0011 [Candidatus Moranbacteria bacterium GW2011_GWE2_35_164]KKP85171.1 MAG: hypothetical protein UR83_C0003G0006 [Candidatus Moranbacteria bacterium GW2011_GWF2_35_54]OGS62824.1 MAG: hypothetical protein A2X07_10885 [Flavobacteria bacterium GWF1_32_7]